MRARSPAPHQRARTARTASPPTFAAERQQLRDRVARLELEGALLRSVIAESGIVTGRSPDPTLARIEAHRAAFAALGPMPDDITDPDGFDAWDKRADRCRGLWLAMLGTVPTTIPGVAALAAHVGRHPDTEADAALCALLAIAAALMPGRPAPPQ